MGMRYNRKPPPEWHAEAQRLRDLGMPIKELAATFKKTEDAVRWAVDERGYRTMKLECIRNGRAGIIAFHSSDSAMIQRHVPRKIPPKVDPMPFARLFAAGLIDRETLSKMLRSGVTPP